MFDELHLHLTIDQLTVEQRDRHGFAVELDEVPHVSDLVHFEHFSCSSTRQDSRSPTRAMTEETDGSSGCKMSQTAVKKISTL
eukprot:751389-Hanusia_phi.AAC.2